MECFSFKRVLSLFLIAVLIITLFPSTSISSSATTNPLGNKVIELALGENGYCAGSTKDNKYGREFYKNNCDWCALFVAWCMKHAGVPSTVYNWNGEWWNYPASTYNNAIAAPSLIRSGKFHYRDKDSYVPKAGDTIYFDWDYRSPYIENSQHIELVVSYKDGVLTTIGGNTGGDNGKVSIRTIRKSDFQYRAIVGYGEIDYTGKSEAVIPGQIPRPYYDGYSGGGYSGIVLGSNNPDDHAVPTYTLGLNSRGDAVQWVQAVLNKVSGTSLSIDGIYGQGTKNAVRNYQSSHGLFPVDGVVGPVTRASMIAEWNAKKYIAPTSIVINSTSMDMTVGKTKQLSANIGPSNATDKTITWTSTDNEVATVKNGVITGVKEGSATITATTCNGKTASCKVQVYKPYTITFVNDDGTVLSTQIAEHGGSAIAPKNPEKIGYTFAGWNGTYQNVKADATVTATYSKKTYKVTFKETDGTKIGTTQNVPYGDAAIAPEESLLNIPEGYAFAGWSETFDCVTSDLEIYPVYQWADDELPITVSADENACIADYEDGIYSLSFDLINHSDTECRARVMTYMITDNGKMVAQGETRTVKIPAATVSEDGSIVDGVLSVDDMHVVCSNSADKARIVVLDDYQSAVPLAEIEDIAVEVSGYGEWSDNEPTEADMDYKSRTVYHAKSVNYKTSTTTNAITGWTLYDTKTATLGNGDKVWYASGKGSTAPSKSGVYRVWAEPIYYAYNPNVYTIPTYNISISTTGGTTYQNMVRWIQCCLCRFGYNTTIDGVYGYNTASVMKVFQRDHGLAADGIVGAATRTLMQNKLNEQHVYNYYYESKKTTNTYYFYQLDENWSDWCVEEIEGDTVLKAGTTKTLVESKTQYSYKNDVTENTGTIMKPACKLPEDAMKLAGKEAVVIVFKNKVNQIAEDNVQYIGNTIIGSDGSLDISFIPREEQSYEGTGDYTVVLGVKGTSNYVKVGTIVAPKPVYKVTFVDDDGTEISAQEVEEGKNAQVPESPTKKGYIFVGWDTGVTNIHSDLTITAQYKKEKCTVTYVDWENRTFDSSNYEYGDMITLPEEPIAPEGMQFVGWGIDDYTKVTEDIVCEAQFEKQEFKVTFIDWNGEVVIEEDVQYGESAMSPEIVEEGVEKEHTVPEKIGDMSFVSWGEDMDLSNVTTDLVIGAIYEYDKTVSIPNTSLESGEYTTNQKVELTADLDGTQILYTLDGSDPTDQGNDAVLEYEEPISIETTTSLRYFARKTGMNDSKVAENRYVINKDGSSAQHIVKVETINVFDSLEIADYEEIVADASLIDLNILLDNEYELIELKGIYLDEEFQTEWPGTAITESITLYAKYDMKQFDVTYCDEDGTVLTTKEVTYGSSLDDSLALAKEGYRFTGWKCDGDVEFVTRDMKVTASYVPVEQYAVIVLGSKDYSVMEGATIKISSEITYEATGELANDEYVIWSVSDDNVATIDTEGNVTALAKGEVVITAQVASTGEMAECNLVVTGSPETSICLMSDSEYQIEKGCLNHIPTGANTVAEVKKHIDGDNLRFYDDSNIELEDTDCVGTGTRIQLLNQDGAMLDEVVIVINGDYNGDGIVNGKDISGITRYLMNKEVATGVKLQAMDLNGDGEVNNRDAAMLGRYLVGKEAIE